MGDEKLVAAGEYEVGAMICHLRSGDGEHDRPRCRGRRWHDYFLCSNRLSFPSQLLIIVDNDYRAEIGC